jgi:hypothetical protein
MKRIEIEIFEKCNRLRYLIKKYPKLDQVNIFEN